MKFSNLAYSALAAVALSAMGATSASAATIINFDQSNGTTPGGSISYDGEGGSLTGNGIRFDSIRLSENGTATGDELFCQGCTLDFTTGDNTSASGNNYTFAGGGSFVLTGSAHEDNAQGNEIASGELVRGVFTDDFSGPSVNRSGENGLRFGADGTDTKDPALLQFFGIDPNTDFTFSNTVISLNNADFDENGGFTATATAADINNSTNDNGGGTPVPEPEELGIFGLGLALLLIGVFSRRRFGNELS